MEKFYYEVWFPISRFDEIEQEKIDEVVREVFTYPDPQSILALGNDSVVILGWIHAGSENTAANMALTAAQETYKERLELTGPWEYMVTRDDAEQLAFVNTGVKDEYQMTMLCPRSVLQYSAEAIKRDKGTKDAMLYIGEVDQFPDTFHEMKCAFPTDDTKMGGKHGDG